MKLTKHSLHTSVFTRDEVTQALAWYLKTGGWPYPGLENRSVNLSCNDKEGTYHLSWTEEA